MVALGQNDFPPFTLKTMNKLAKYYSLFHDLWTCLFFSVTWWAQVYLCAQIIVDHNEVAQVIRNEIVWHQRKSFLCLHLSCCAIPVSASHHTCYISRAILEIKLRLTGLQRGNNSYNLLLWHLFPFIFISICTTSVWKPLEKIWFAVVSIKLIFFNSRGGLKWPLQPPLRMHPVILVVLPTGIHVHAF